MKKSILLLTAILSAGFISCAQVDKGTTDQKKEKKSVKKEVVQKSDKKDSPAKPIYLNKADFLKKVMNYEKNTEEWVYEGDKPCVIDFYADWCAPCKKAAPVLEKLAKEYSGKIYVYKIDTEKEKELAGVFGIRSIPAFLWVPKDGKPQMTNGIARTTEDTEKMFKDLIDNVLLKETEK